MRCFPSAGAKAFRAMVMLFFATGLYQEWKVYVRPVRTLYVIHGIRARRFLKRLGRIPSDVPFLYGIVLMLSLARTAWIAFFSPGASAVSYMNALAWVLN